MGAREDEYDYLFKGKTSQITVKVTQVRVISLLQDSPLFT